eukprot:gene35616-46190_t
MSIVREKYTEKRVNLIYQMLLNEKEAGNAKDYDVSIDELIVISRNRDPERFFDHEDFIQDDTKNEQESTHQQALAGIEKTIDDRLSQAKEQWDHDQLKKENESLREEVEELEKYSEVLQNTISILEAEKQKSSSKITDAVIGLAGVYLSKNPNVLSGLPLIGDFLGSDVKTDSSSQNSVDDAEAIQDSKVSFSKKQQTYSGTIGEEDVERLENALIPLFPGSHLEKNQQSKKVPLNLFTQQKTAMPLYTLPIQIEANSRKEAEEKLLTFMKIAAEHKKVTLNDVLGSVTKLCSELSVIAQRHNKAMHEIEEPLRKMKGLRNK